MRILFASAAIVALGTGGAMAADPVGDWLVKDGYAHIRIDNCAGKMWGIVAWEKSPGGIDTENPDPAKKSRLTLGIPILMGLAQKEPNKWQGEIYNSQNGKMYDASISLADENTLDLEGCLVWPLCQTQKWTRVKTPPPNALPLPPIKSAAPPPAKQTTAKSAPAAPPQSDVCARVAEQTTPAGAAPAKQVK